MERKWRSHVVVFAPNQSGPFNFEAKGDVHHGIEIVTSSGVTCRVWEAYSRQGVGFFRGALHRACDYIEFWADPNKVRYTYFCSLLFLLPFHHPSLICICYIGSSNI
jgi:hypothetical protein